MSKKSFDHLYVARGLGILLVIIGHIIPQESYFGMTIYSFHMPLFIFLSGIFAHSCKDTKFLPYLKKNFVHILVPYFVFLAWGLLLNFIVPEWRTALTPENFKELVLSLNPWFWKATGALWFLPALFIARLMFYFYDKFVLSKGNRSLTLITIAALFYIAFYAVVFEQFAGIHIYFQIKSALISLPFYSIGYLLSDEIKNFKVTKKSYSAFIILAVCLCLTLRFAARYNHYVNLGGNWYNDSFLFIIFALSGITAIIILSAILKNAAILQFFGKESMNIFLIHFTFQHLIELYITNVMQQEVERGFTMQNVVKFLMIVTLSSLYACAITKIKSKNKARKEQKVLK